MTELIKALIGVKDPLTLIGFISVVVLIAFRTRAVPETFFRLLEKKLTRERFARLLHRAMIYGLILALALCVVAAGGQVLAAMSRPRTASVDDLVSEIRSLKATEDGKKQAVTTFEASLRLAADQKFDQAVASLKSSIQAVPTLTAQATLAYLYLQLGDKEDARREAERAGQLARERGDTLAAVRAARLEESSSVEAQVREAPSLEDAGPTQHSPFLHVDRKLPDGGRSYESALELAAGSYRGAKDYDRRSFYSVQVKAKEFLKVRVRTRDETAGLDLELFDQDGGRVAGATNIGNAANVVIEASWQSFRRGPAFISVKGAARDAVFVVSLQ